MITMQPSLLHCPPTYFDTGDEFPVFLGEFRVLCLRNCFTAWAQTVRFTIAPHVFSEVAYTTFPLHKVKVRQLYILLHLCRSQFFVLALFGAGLSSEMWDAGFPDGVY